MLYDHKPAKLHAMHARMPDNGNWKKGRHEQNTLSRTQEKTIEVDEFFRIPLVIHILRVTTTQVRLSLLY